MLAIFRIILIFILSVGICIFGIIYCMLKPSAFNHASIFAHLFGRMAPIFGIKLEIRNLLGLQEFPKHCVYIANHQNNYDMVTVSYVLPPRTITIGKKSLLWIPLFGQLYWLSGNILVNRIQRKREHGFLINKIVKFIKQYDASVWIFPEGTRSRGRGLLPFKTGAFRIAITAKVPIVPICVSNLSNNKIRLNRWSNGLVIIAIMQPVDTYLYGLQHTRSITKYCYDIMQLKLEELNKEVAIREINL